MSIDSSIPESEELRALLLVAGQTVGAWVSVRAHDWTSLYCWRDTPLFNAFGETVGQMKANTIYLDRSTPCPDQDLFHELGHAIARRFDLIGHYRNGFLGPWEQRQRRMIGAVGHQRHWSRLLERVRRNAPPYTPDLCSEIWAELFMNWYLFPARRETTYIEPEMRQLAGTPELDSIERLNRLLRFESTTTAPPPS